MEDGELVLNEKSSGDSVPLLCLSEQDLSKCLEAVAATWQLLPALEDEDARERVSCNRVVHALPFDLRPEKSHVRYEYAPEDFGRCRRNQSLPSVVSWYTIPARSKLLEQVPVSAADVEQGSGPRSRQCTEYTARYTFPNMEHTLAARRGNHNKDATWRAGIGDFKKSERTEHATAGNAGDWDSSSDIGYEEREKELEQERGPGKYTAEEGLEMMLDRVRVPPSFGRAQRYFSRW